MQAFEKRFDLDATSEAATWSNLGEFFMMAVAGASFARSYMLLQASPRSMCSRCLRLRRTISTSTSENTGEGSATKSQLKSKPAPKPIIPYEEVEELDNASSFDAAPITDPYDPLAASRGRKRQLPRGAYVHENERFHAELMDSKLPVSTSKVRQGTTSPSPISRTLRSCLSRICSWTLFNSAP